MGINFSGIKRSSIVGKGLRNILNLVPKNAVVRVLQGSLKGKKWIVGSGTHGYWLGSYEYEKQKIFYNNIHIKDVVYDIGANVGFYTLLASSLVGSKGYVYAFEPFPDNVKFLKKHIELNKIKNVSIIEAAVGNQNRNVFFKTGDDNFSGRIDNSGEITVSSISLDSFISENLLPNILKIDVEGEEYNVLLGAKLLLQKTKPIIFLATHSEEQKELCLNYLNNAGYKSKILGETFPDEFICKF